MMMLKKRVLRSTQYLLTFSNVDVDPMSRRKYSI